MLHANGSSGAVGRADRTCRVALLLAVVLLGGAPVNAVAHEDHDHSHDHGGSSSALSDAGEGFHETVPPEFVAAMVDAANALLEAVSGEPGPIEALRGISREERLTRSLDEESRTDWQYIPGPRTGLTLGEMDASQRRLTHALLTSALSSRGYLKVMQIMQLDEILRVLDTSGMPRTLEDFTLAIWGEPSTESPWGWRFEGHHVSLNITVAAGAISVTPSFLGANPAEVRHGPLTGLRPLGYEEDLGRELVTGLDEAQREQAILAGDPPSDILSGTAFLSEQQRERWRETLRPDGVPVRELQGHSRTLVRRILDEVVTTYHPEISATYLARIDLNTLHFAWIGSTTYGEPHYFRLLGEDFVFEYDNVQNEGNHVHTVWRDRSDDFGESLLERHYERHH